jgi:hypothetical protein
MPTVEDDTKMLKFKFLQLETTLDKLILPICLMASWLLANLCFVVTTLIGSPIPVSAVIALGAFVATLIPLRLTLSRSHRVW